jgi:hypothetical protein
MEHIQSIREIVEKLAGDEKMDDGQYLEVMNRLKSLYEREEQKGPSFREDFRMEFASGDANAVRVSESERRSFVRRIALDEPMRLFHHYFVGLSRNDVSCDGSHFHEVMPKLAEALEDGTMATRTDISRHCIGSILYWGAVVWRNLDHRELVLRNRHYTDYELESHTRFRNYTASMYIYRGYKPNGEMDEYCWERLFHDWIPFYTTKRVFRKDWRDREEKELKKLHPIRLSLKIPNHPIELDLYTDKVKLGATGICRQLQKLMLAIVRLEGWTDVPLERLMFDCGLNLTLEVSGITAQSRDKERRYTGVFGLVEVVYLTKYSK